MKPQNDQSSIELFSYSTPNSIKPMILLEELGLAYTLTGVNIKKGEQKTAEFLALNPNGKVPVLRAGGQVITESAAIMVFLAEKYQRFIPTAPADRVQMFEWLFFHASALGPSFGQAGFFKKMAPEKLPIAIDRFDAEAKRTLRVLDQQLAKREFLAGEYSIADMVNFGWIWRREFAEVTLDDLPNVQCWYDWMGQRPAVKIAIERAMALAS